MKQTNRKIRSHNLKSTVPNGLIEYSAELLAMKDPTEFIDH